jgi:hypothetical protein
MMYGDLKIDGCSGNCLFKALSGLPRLAAADRRLSVAVDVPIATRLLEQIEQGVDDAGRLYLLLSENVFVRIKTKRRRLHAELAGNSVNIRSLRSCRLVSTLAFKE